MHGLLKKLFPEGPVADFAMAKRFCSGRKSDKLLDSPSLFPGVLREAPVAIDEPALPVPLGDYLRALAERFRKEHPATGATSHGYQFLMKEATTADLRARGFNLPAKIH